MPTGPKKKCSSTGGDKMEVDTEVIKRALEDAKNKEMALATDPNESPDMQTCYFDRAHGIQAAIGVIEDMEQVGSFRSCRQCGQPFEPTAENKVMCSNRCAVLYQASLEGGAPPLYDMDDNYPFDGW